MQALKSTRAYKSLGCLPTKTAGTYRFAVWAPNAKFVSLLGDFNGWDPFANPMTWNEGGVWTAELSGLSDGMAYKYAIQPKDGVIFLKADPFARYAETGPATASKVWNIEGYAWSDRDWLQKRAKWNAFAAPMSIYELHLGSWKLPEDGALPNYRTIAEALCAYVKDMGFTHVELMPLTEYPYDGSWGYQTTGYFAPTSRYGTPQDFMYLVDHLHKSGIGVILDWVGAHFPRDAHGLARFDGTPLFEGSDPRMAAHPEWGTLIFDYARPEIKNFLISSAEFFFDYYHIDGLRIDAVSSMLYLDYGRKNGDFTRNKFGGNINLGAVDMLRELNASILSDFPGAVTIAEESTAYPLVTAPPYDGGLGFSFKWDMGFMHDTLNYFAMDPLFRKGSHEKLTFSMMYAFSENFVLPFSHDEVVHGKRSMLDKMFGGYAQKFATLKALYGYMYAHPGKKLLFMGCEFGQFIEWNYKQQLDWLLLDYPSHEGLRAYVRALNRFYARRPEFYEADKSWEGFAWKSVDERERSSIAFLRRDKSGAEVLCAFNFTPVPQNINVPLPKGKHLRILLSSAEERFGGGGERHSYANGLLTLPGMCAMYFSVNG
ncbi:MAG: 1,4-alpha-glucan branching protein GlgB [Firmicutes bacterium]|nr:1,4-alpha-glucan branching protein GlgB [Bacillota bacterium]